MPPLPMDRHTIPPIATTNRSLGWRAAGHPAPALTTTAGITATASPSPFRAMPPAIATDHIAAAPTTHGTGTRPHERRTSGDDHDHNHDEGGSGNDEGDEDSGAASPLEDVLKLIRPR